MEALGPQYVGGRHQHPYDLQLEAKDPLRVNSVRLQFLAFTPDSTANCAYLKPLTPSSMLCLCLSVPPHLRGCLANLRAHLFAPVPGSGKHLFFTFQFYRFPHLTTERLVVRAPAADASEQAREAPRVLMRLDPTGAVRCGQALARNAVITT